MHIDKSYIKSLSRDSVLQVLAICVEVLQEEAANGWMPDDAEKKRIDAIVNRHARGDGKSYTKEEFRKNLDNLMTS